MGDLHGLKPVILMVLAQFSFAGLMILYKLAANDGMNMRILIAYRWMFSAAFTVPLALIIERKRPKFTWMIFFQSFISGLLGATLSQNLYAESLVLTSATFVAAISNLGPAITLILAAFFRMEKLGLRSSAGKLKILGILIGISGAMVITFYKGIQIKIWSPNLHLLKNNSNSQLHSHIQVLGSCMALGSSFSYALWLVLQTKISKTYPCHYSNIALMSVMGSVQCVILALCFDRNWSQWRLGWNLRLLAIAYSGKVSSGLVMTFIPWCICMRGPVFVASFKPLSLVLVAITGVIILEEKLYLGSIIGAGVIVYGLYMLIWGQNKEIKDKKAKLIPTEGIVTNPTQDAQRSSPKEQHACSK